METKTQVKTQVMTTKHPGWKRFCRLLGGPEGCNFRNDKNGQRRWKCAGGNSQVLAKKILKKYFPKVNITKSCAYFSRNGGHCDCEILFNVGS